MTEAAQQTFAEGMSPAMRARIETTIDAPYAQLYVRLTGQEELVLILAEQKVGHSGDLWIGGGGVKLFIDNSLIRHSEGLLTDIVRTEVLRAGPVSAYLRGEVDVIDRHSPSVVWMQTSQSPEWIEQVAQVVRVQDVSFSSLAYQGPAIEVVERVQVTGLRENFDRVLWIEPRTRALLRMSTKMGKADSPLLLEWVRLPDRSDNR
ncbi:MAG: YjbF family lipoprotein [Pseudomonadota bacterium]|nr:YjbF family lipoprotein [Pseudomonadota bacterium]